MKLWENKKCKEIEEDSNYSDAIQDAKKVCEKLQIPHYTLNCETEFQKYVVDNFINCYANCQTPNPCIECNKYLKFGVFYKKALELANEKIIAARSVKEQKMDQMEMSFEELVKQRDFARKGKRGASCPKESKIRKRTSGVISLPKRRLTADC